MKIQAIGCIWVLVILLPSAFGSEIIETQTDTISTLFEIIAVIYDYDVDRIPDEPNEILALENSADSIDQLAWEIFKLIQYEIDPNSRSDPSIDELADNQDALVEDEGFYSCASETAEIENESFGYYALQEDVEYLAGPLDTCILESKTYLITSLPLQITGHVVIPAGAKLIAPFDPNNFVIEVVPGGLLDTGKAGSYAEEDYPDILPMVEILSEDPNFVYCHNNVGIYVHRGADPRTRIDNITIENCTVGVIIDESLDYPVRNVITVGCYDGIHLYAPANIVDCEFWNNGTVYLGFYGYIGTGIYVALDWDDNLAEVVIDRTTLYFADVALYVEGGSADPNSEPNEIIPNVIVQNTCLTSGLFYGLYQSQGEAFINVQYCAFGDNRYNTNIELPFTGCFELYDFPFYNREEDWKKLYISPYSELIDTGYGVATDGMGVRSQYPDLGNMDIGCHFSMGITGGFGMASSPADFNWDGIVDERDLALMNACMRATNDPNLLAMDMDYDSWINLPDFKVYVQDYGWAADPNFSLISDPNCVRSDFNKDGFVNYNDLEVLASLWLTPVFDEYRICSLCNLHTGIDPNDPNAPGGSGIIDQRDMDALEADWGKTVQTDCSISFYNEQDIAIEPNDLSGTVNVVVEDYPFSTWMFAQLDGLSVDEIYNDSGVPLFTLPTYMFANGYHTLTIGGYTPEDGCWIQTFPVILNNWLYFARIPDMYKQNELYEITGFFDGGVVEIATDPNDSTISSTGYVKHSSVISTASAEATLTYENQQVITTSTFALTAIKDMSEVDPNSFRALIVAPDEDANIEFDVTLQAIRDTLRLKGISLIELLHKNATWDNISIALRGNNLNYVYWIGHGNSQVGERRDRFTLKVLEEAIHRTSFRCWKKGLIKDSDQDKIFSFLVSDGLTQPAVPETLSDRWDARGHSMWSLRLWESKKIKEFWAICCETGLEWENNGTQYEFINDMANAVGAYRKDNNGNYVSVYMGNKTPVWMGQLNQDAIYYPDAIAGIIRYHSNSSLDSALINGPHGTEELKAVWGPDLTKGNDNNKDGYIDNILQWWPKTTKLDWIQFF